MILIDDNIITRIRKITIENNEIILYTYLDSNILDLIYGKKYFNFSINNYIYNVEINSINYIKCRNGLYAFKFNIKEAANNA